MKTTLVSETDFGDSGPLEQHMSALEDDLVQEEEEMDLKTMGIDN